MNPLRVLPMLFALLPPLVAHAADPPADAVHRAKLATALLISPTPSGESMVGTAFCINSHRQFVTCAHVVQGIFTMGKVQLLLTIASGERVLAEGHLQHADRKADIALLQLDSDVDVTPIPIAYRSDLKAAMSVTGLGYFDPPDPILGDGGFQPITQMGGRITGLPATRGFVTQIQMKAESKPGYDGGPLLNEKGEVIGILQGQSKDDHMALALPGDYIQDILVAPKLKCAPVDVRVDALTHPVEMSADLADELAGAPYADVEFRVDTEVGKQRTYSAQTKDGKHYTVVVKPSDVGSARWIQINALFDVTALRNGSRVAHGLAFFRIARDRPPNSP